LNVSAAAAIVMHKVSSDLREPKYWKWPLDILRTFPI
jgi:hypothetical protein